MAVSDQCPGPSCNLREPLKSCPIVSKPNLISEALIWSLLYACIQKV